MSTKNFKTYPLLTPLAWLYGLGVRLRNELFDHGVMKEQRFSLPLIAVGNLAVGGTGKTPHTEYLLRLLKDEWKTAMLSRGYGRGTKGFLIAGPSATAHDIGDEPLQMLRKFPDVTIAVDARRADAICRLLTLTGESEIEAIVLDDAFQHRYVKPGLSLLLTDYNRLYSADALLPAGRLREPIEGASRADIIIVTKCPDNLSPIDFRVVENKLKPKSYQQLFFTSLRYGTPYPLFPDEKQEVPDWHLADVLVLTGIAHPEHLTDYVRARARSLRSMAFPDHHKFTEADVERINQTFLALPTATRMIITTEKDAARLANLPTLSPSVRATLYVQPIEIYFLNKQEEQFTKTITDYVRKNQRNRSVD